MPVKEEEERMRVGARESNQLSGRKKMNGNGQREEASGREAAGPLTAWVISRLKSLNTYHRMSLILEKKNGSTGDCDKESNYELNQDQDQV